MAAHRVTMEWVHGRSLTIPGTKSNTVRTLITWRGIVRHAPHVPLPSIVWQARMWNVSNLYLCPSKRISRVYDILRITSCGGHLCLTCWDSLLWDASSWVLRGKRNRVPEKWEHNVHPNIMYGRHWAGHCSAMGWRTKFILFPGFVCETAGTYCDSTTYMEVSYYTRKMCCSGNPEDVGEFPILVSKCKLHKAKNIPIRGWLFRFKKWPEIRDLSSACLWDKKRTSHWGSNKTRKSPDAKLQEKKKDSSV